MFVTLIPQKSHRTVFRHSCRSHSLSQCTEHKEPPSRETDTRKDKCAVWAHRKGTSSLHGTARQFLRVPSSRPLIGLCLGHTAGNWPLRRGDFCELACRGARRWSRPPPIKMKSAVAAREEVKSSTHCRRGNAFQQQP
ncbi:uncharacterized protein Tco025E_09694 [Trypanosoma conorhini]|uniref:Uncharacterized protein n=1 Tax=Trypanosoma conorhini TaxID=83891 RepID=A0A3R7R608_9TRYP|nr:uncharacterized protein Tco025E_09694 [Trypanosoma conorhini]RNE96591.1 hypothetical protein Tco025E_09694 [Trypanosoma conorhini]